MIYNFTKQQENRILEEWGYDFLRILHLTVRVLSEKWKLSDLEFGEYYRGYAIFFCKSALYGDCVLKISRDGDEPLSDYNSFCEHFNEQNGRYHVKAYGHDDGALLVERAIPGIMLSEEPSLEKRLAVFSDMFKERHIEAKRPELFKSFINVFDYYMDYVIDRPEELKELYVHTMNAVEICTKILIEYDKKMLIHLDLCAVNIVSSGNGQYKIIDPDETVIGDPVFETGRMIGTECCQFKKDRNVERAEFVVNYLEKSLNIPNKILRQCLYLDTVIEECKNSRWGEPGRIIDTDRLLFAESIMNNGNN